MSFTTPIPPAADAPWTAIQWHRLTAGEPLTLVRSALRWHGGFIARGSDTSSTPIWTSTDGAHWERLPFNTAQTFWSGLLVVGVAEIHGNLVALTLLAGTWDCGGAATCPRYSPTLPLMSWISHDGRSWSPYTGPDLGPPAQWQSPPFLASTLAGLVAISPTPPAVVATSADGIHWRTVPAGALRAAITVKAVVGSSPGLGLCFRCNPGGFTAVGTLQVDEGHDRAVAMWSGDGTTWTGPFPLDQPSASRVTLASTGPSWGATALVAARNGFIAVGHDFGTPGATLWWQSTDARDWRSAPTYAPLGPTTCTGEGCGSQPDGTLVGDGHRMVALRGGAHAAVWTSIDGVNWQRLAVTGDPPTEQATQAVMLPGGVLLSDGTTTWFGEAEGP